MDGTLILNGAKTQLNTYTFTVRQVIVKVSG